MCKYMYVSTGIMGEGGGGMGENPKGSLTEQGTVKDIKTTQLVTGMVGGVPQDPNSTRDSKGHQDLH